MDEWAKVAEGVGHGIIKYQVDANGCWAGVIEHARGVGMASEAFVVADAFLNGGTLVRNHREAAISGACDTLVLQAALKQGGFLGLSQAVSVIGALVAAHGLASLADEGKRELQKEADVFMAAAVQWNMQSNPPSSELAAFGAQHYKGKSPVVDQARLDSLVKKYARRQVMRDGANLVIVDEGHRLKVPPYKSTKKWGHDSLTDNAAVGYLRGYLMPILSRRG